MYVVVKAKAVNPRSTAKPACWPIAITRSDTGLPLKTLQYDTSTDPIQDGDG